MNLIANIYHFTLYGWYDKDHINHKTKKKTSWCFINHYAEEFVRQLVKEKSVFMQRSIKEEDLMK